MNILITRTAPFSVFERGLSKLRKEFPGSHITVLIQSSYQNQIKKYLPELASIVIPDGNFRLSHRISREIRGVGFDMLVLLYNNPAGRGYLKLDFFSLLTGINKIMIYDVNDNFYQVNSKTKRVLRKFFTSMAGGLIYAFMNFIVSIWYLWRRENGHQSISLFLLVTGVLVHWCTTYL
jgi:hypothetical protein